MARVVSRLASIAWAAILAAGAAPAAQAAGTIFLARCAPAGCVYTPGFEDSRINRSSLLNQTAQIPAFPHGDAAWAEHLACVQRAFAPFDVVVTEVDPGTATHWEIVVAGLPSHIGFPSGIAGVSPFTCGVIQNGIAFSFAEVYAASEVKELCWTTAHEAAHLLGLDHEVLQRDPMTYLEGCKEKVFAPADAPCGTTVPETCLCGGSTQNSHAMLTAVLGPGGPGTPLFVDGFSVEGVDPEEASTCRWDGAVSLLPGGPGLELRALRCGTEGLLGGGAPPARRNGLPVL